MSLIQLIDLYFQDMPGVIGIPILDTGDGLLAIDIGPTSTLPIFEESLKSFGASLKDLRFVLLTHIHLDHAGAIGTVLKRTPLRVYVHEQGAKHLVSPERLIGSAARIYGDLMGRLWGEMLPVESDSLTVLQGGETLNIGSLKVQAFYTPGHAVHHISYHIAEDLFVGDVGGVRLDSKQTPRAPTPPPDIDLAAWHKSIKLLRKVKARNLYLTHFGAYAQEDFHWDNLLANLNIDALRVKRLLENKESLDALTVHFQEAISEDLQREGPNLLERFLFASPPWMSAQGLIRYWQQSASSN